MRRLFLLVCAAALGACAPAPARGSVPQSAPLSGELRADFSPAGVVWAVGGRGCVARVPDLLPVCSDLHGVTDVAWQEARAWGSVPGLGLVAALDGAPQTVQAGAVAALSKQYIYRQDGSALTYGGQLAAHVLAGGPTRAVTVTNGPEGTGQDFVLLAGRWLRSNDGSATQFPPAPYLTATPLGTEASVVPAVANTYSHYRLQNGRLERLDWSGKLLNSIPSVGVSVGLVGEQVVTLDSDGTLRRYSAGLQPL